MKTLITIIIFTLLASTSYAKWHNSYTSSSSPKLYADDGTYLGKVNNDRYDPDSISNPYGKYGNKYNPNSVNNPYGKYGSQYSPDSPNFGSSTYHEQPSTGNVRYGQ